MLVLPRPADQAAEPRTAALKLMWTPATVLLDSTDQAQTPYTVLYGPDAR